MKPGDIINRLGDALPLIRQICDISGVPGASIGVFHEDQKIYTTHIGHRDVAAKLPPTSDTIVAGAVIEKLSGKPAYQYIRETILDPLGLANTTTRPVVDQDCDFAEAYSALEDATLHHLPRALPFKGSLFELAGGLFSTVNDMLKYAQAMLRAQMDAQASPLQNLEILFQGHVPLVQSDKSFGSYGMGWIATHLPGVVGLQGDDAELFDLDELARIGNDTNLIKTLYHQGAGLGYYLAMYLFPESKSGFVVLTNSMPLNDAADWIAQVVATALHGFQNTTDYVEFAHESRQRKVRNVSAMKVGFDRIREDNPGIDPRPLRVYCGRYRNVLGNFFIDIRQSLKDAHLLELLFLGREQQMYQLRHLQGDMFEWAPDYDEQARRARFTRWDTAYFQIGVHFKDEHEASSLEWAGGQTLVALHQSQSVIRDGLIHSSGNSDSDEL